MITSGLIVLVVGYYLAAFLVSIFQCTPVSKSWSRKQPGTCIDLDRFRYYTAAVNIITSVFLIATPLPALSKMRQSRPEVTELMGLILLGLVDINTKSGTSITPLTIAIVEMDIGIIAAALIVMRPCFKMMRNVFSMRGRFLDISSAESVGTRSRKISSGNSVSPPRKNIVQTIDIEMESHPTVIREVTAKDVF
ncbi:MAG: hypothetical protein Q9201_006968 [Fulgogasparrea decipioides]